MDRSSADAFVYSKASGMLAKSFIGSRAAKLFSVSSLQELWSLVFDSEVPALPETMLAKKIEQDAESRFINDYVSLLRNYSRPDKVLVELLRFYDYDNLKDIAASLCNARYSTGKPEPPYLADIKEFSMLRYKAWPDVAGITAGSPVSWYNTVPDFSHQQEFDSKLDLQYIRTLLASIEELPLSSRSVVSDLIQGEVVMNNILWAIRLRVYYGMDKEQVVSRLVTVRDCSSFRDVKNDRLAGAAVRTLDWDLESYADWANWKYAPLLNPHEEGVVWQIDPRWVQQVAKVRFNSMALRQFHRHPFTASVLVTWFKIKQYELDCIRTAAEGLRLSVPQDQVQEFVGVAAAQA